MFGTGVAKQKGKRAAIRGRNKEVYVNRQIVKHKAVVNSLIKFGDDNKGVIDDKARADLVTYATELDESDKKRQDTRQAFIESKDVLALAVDDLGRSVIQSRKVLESHAVVTRTPSRAPKARPGMYLTSRIYNVAVSHLEALESLKGDPAIDLAAAALKASMGNFSTALSDMKAKQMTWKELNEQLGEKLATIAGKLIGYKAFATYNMPRTGRKELRNILRAIVPPREKSRKAASKPTKGTMPDPTKTTEPPKQGEPVNAGETPETTIKTDAA